MQGENGVILGMYSGLVGNPRPTFEWVPEFYSSAGQDAVYLARESGLVMDDWQSHVLSGGLAETGQFTIDGQPIWANNEVCCICGRQNGKGGIIEARELAGVFIFKEDLIIHSAHQQRTSNDAFLRMKRIVQSNPDLDRRVMAIAHSKGEEGFTFRVKVQRGQFTEDRDLRLRYMARSGRAGRGFSKGNCVIIDEAMILDDPPVAALLPIMATQPSWQVWYMASQGDRRLPTSSRVLGRIRRRGYRKEPGLAFYEWAAHLRHDKNCPRNDDGEFTDALDVRGDPRTWAKVNPAMNLVRANGTMGVAESFLRKMIVGGGMAQWDADREFLGVGDYPTDDGWEVIGEQAWNSLFDPTSKRGKHFAVGIEVSWDGETTAITIASLRDDGVYHWEMVECQPGTNWVPDYCAVLNRKRPILFVGHEKSPTNVIIPDLRRRRLKVYCPSWTEYASWCAKTLQLITETGGIRHLAQPTMDEAVKAVQKHNLSGGEWTWERAEPTGLVAPFIAGTLALGGLLVGGTRRARPLVASVAR